MNFASMKFFLVGLTLTAMLSACSDDETSDLIPEYVSVDLTETPLTKGEIQAIAWRFDELTERDRKSVV